jgi:hypothetical protein
MDLSYKLHNVKFEYFDKSWHVFEDMKHSEIQNMVQIMVHSFFLVLPSVIFCRNIHPFYTKFKGKMLTNRANTRLFISQPLLLAMYFPPLNILQCSGFLNS